MKGKILVLALCLALSALLAFSAQAGQKVKLVIWHPYGGEPQKMFQDSIAEYNRTHPDTEASELNVAWDGFQQKLATATLSGTAPDMAHVWGSGQAIVYADMGVVVALDDFLKNDPTINIEDMYPGMRGNFTWKGKVWGWPDTGQVAILYWNKDLFTKVGLDSERPPKTFDEVYAYADKLFKKDAVGKFDTIAYLPADIWGGMFNFIGLWGGKLFDDEAQKSMAANPTAIQALKWMVDYYNRYGGLESVANFMAGFKGIGQGDHPWLLGREGMWMNNQWVLSFTDRLAPGRFKYGIGASIVSSGPGSKGPLAGTDANIMLKGSMKHPKEAWEFFKWWAARDGAKFRMENWNTATGTVSLNKTIRLSGYWNDQVWSIFNQAMSNSKSWPSTPVLAIMQNRMTNEIDQALRNNKTPEQALRDVDAFVNAELDKRRK
jgi:multiple sugar transport system substrate-binding protein